MSYRSESKVLNSLPDPVDRVPVPGAERDEEKIVDLIHAGGRGVRVEQINEKVGLNHQMLLHHFGVKVIVRKFLHIYYNFILMGFWGFGAIGKGFAADATKKLMKSLGVSSGIINASGDLTSWGKKPDGTDWQVGISNPENPTKVFSWFPVRDAAVATSGNYEKYVTLEGKQYSHIMDPRTGMPVSGIKSVTVFAPNAELADAFATAVFIMGIDTGIDTISQLPGMSCIIVDAENNIHHSPNIQWANIKK